MAGFNRRRLRWLILPAVAVVLLFAGRTLWLPAIGTALERDNPPCKADLAVVLAGDGSGGRVLKAAQLARDGYVPKVLVSGPSGNYGFYECDLAVPFAVRHGYPESLFLRAPHDARSTGEEVALLVPLLRRLGVKSLLLVTSDFHTGRAGRTFRAAAPDLAIYTVAVPDGDFRLERWWEKREGRKCVFTEWLKTLAEWLRV